MVAYDLLFENLATEAAAAGGIALESFIARLRDQGVPEERIFEMLLADFDSGGALFGSFLRDLSGAAGASSVAASSQGEIVGAVAEDAALKRLLNLADVDDVIDDIIETADPGAAAEIEDAVAHVIDLTWIAELTNTCHLCLPLHGITRTAEEWRELGLHPSTIHVNAGWKSTCHCRFVQRDTLGSRAETIAPLTRTKLKSATGLKGSRRTARAVAQADIERSRAAVRKAQESAEGRRTLRLLGMVSEEPEET